MVDGGGSRGKHQELFFSNRSKQYSLTMARPIRANLKEEGILLPGAEDDILEHDVAFDQQCMERMKLAKWGQG